VTSAAAAGCQKVKNALVAARASPNLVIGIPFL